MDESIGVDISGGPTIGDVVKSLAAFGCAHAEIIRLEVFGSVAQGEANAQNDVGMVVTFASDWKRAIDGFAYFGHLDDLAQELAATLGRAAHLADRAGVESAVRTGNASLARAIARDGQIVYEAEHSTPTQAETMLKDQHPPSP